MFPSVLLPLVGASALALALTMWHGRLPAAMAARALTFSLVAVMAAAVPALWVVGLEFLSHTTVLGLRLCVDAVDEHARIEPWVGWPVVALAIIGSVRAAAVVITFFRLRDNHSGSVDVLCDRRLFAFTLPGKGGRVVFSSGLVDLLSPDEQAVVLAHEQAHGRCRHDRFLLISRLASAAYPPLRPITNRLVFSLERWADDDAAGQCHDRQLVARTIAKVALHHPASVGVLAIANVGVPGRVIALMQEPVSRPPLGLRLVLATLMVTTVLLSAYQLHHLYVLVRTVCLW
jgi:Zn-dependent protease with chaperone function